MMTYLNNAATTFPKPREVLAAVNQSLTQPPVEPGRSSAAADPTWECRQELAALFRVPDPRHIILTPSATYSLNLVIQGLLSENAGGHCLSTALEHNSVLRPLEHLRRSRFLEVSYVEPQRDGSLNSHELLAQARPDTRLIAVTHASNVTGCVQPVEEIARAAVEMKIPLLIDASQSAGAIDLNHATLPGRVFVAFAGHKGLFGPTGVGGLIVPDATLPRTFVGGTGVLSESVLHPDELPLRHEAGTMNLPGIAGLTAGVRFVNRRGVAELGAHRQQLVHDLRQRLSGLPGLRLAPLSRGDGRGGIVSFTVRGWSPAQLGFLLRESFGIETRTGLHCAPRLHASLGTLPEGNVRVSVAAFNTPRDIELLATALESTVGAPCVP